VGNEVFGWISVLASLVMGLVMGVKFQREDWMGGYAAFPRRMVRLAHVALAALGMLNVLFAQSLPRLHLSPALARTASFAFMAAAVLMPACCLLLAKRRRHFGLFALPVFSLALALTLTIGGLLR
jgi:hypothetical protein